MSINQRGTAEHWIKEGKRAVKMTRLNCHRFRSDEVRLWLSVIACNLANLSNDWDSRRRSGSTGQNDAVAGVVVIEQMAQISACYVPRCL
jgi:hypothetical protein